MPASSGLNVATGSIPGSSLAASSVGSKIELPSLDLKGRRIPKDVSWVGTTINCDGCTNVERLAETLKGSEELMLVILNDTDGRVPQELLINDAQTYFVLNSDGLETDDALIINAPQWFAVSATGVVTRVFRSENELKDALGERK